MAGGGGSLAQTRLWHQITLFFREYTGILIKNGASKRDEGVRITVYINRLAEITNRCGTGKLTFRIRELFLTNREFLGS
jgi:hypothetical protein